MKNEHLKELEDTLRDFLKREGRINFNFNNCKDLTNIYLGCTDDPYGNNIALYFDLTKLILTYTLNNRFISSHKYNVHLLIKEFEYNDFDSLVSKFDKTQYEKVRRECLSENFQAVAVGYCFNVVPTYELDGIKLKPIHEYIIKDGVIFELYKGKTYEDSKKIDEVLDRNGDLRINDYLIDTDKNKEDILSVYNILIDKADIKTNKDEIIINANKLPMNELLSIILNNKEIIDSLTMYQNKSKTKSTIQSL